MVQMNMEEVESQRRVKQLLNLQKNKHCSCTLKCEYVTGSYFGADNFVTSISNLDLDSVVITGKCTQPFTMCQ